MRHNDDGAVDDALAIPADELRSIGHRLIELADTIAFGTAPAAPLFDGPPPAENEQRLIVPAEPEVVARRRRPDHVDAAPKLVQLAKSLYRLRRDRGRQLDPSLFAEPAWDMLLDLFVSSIAGNRISVTSLSVASAVPPTTALRWISLLEQQGLLRSEASREDHRMRYLSLSDVGLRAMKALLAEQVSRLEREGWSFRSG